MIRDTIRKLKYILMNQKIKLNIIYNNKKKNPKEKPKHKSYIFTKRTPFYLLQTQPTQLTIQGEKTQKAKKKTTPKTK